MPETKLGTSFLMFHDKFSLPFEFSEISILADSCRSTAFDFSDGAANTGKVFIAAIDSTRVEATAKAGTFFIFMYLFPFLNPDLF
ncbi:hypothetical protein [Tumebacillus avium]|uniref:hypothetical protein n=1 Tax=Tumebacillus avium TaxID=1903704 RepID=UPI0018DFE814|nr:hypothetical protein [Tumebacillus avium]